MIAGCGGYRLIQDEGTDLTRRRTIDFVGAGVTATDDAANERTLVTIPGGGGGAVTQIANSTLGGSAASFDITSISSSYNHLWLLAWLRGTNGSLNVETRVRVNNVTGSAYVWERLYGSAASAVAFENLNDTSAFAGWAPGTTGGSNLWGALVIHFTGSGNTAAGYRTWTTQWTLMQGSGSGNCITGMTAAFCTGAAATGAAIDRVTVFPSTGSWAAGSQLSLYGVT